MFIFILWYQRNVELARCNAILCGNSSSSRTYSEKHFLLLFFQSFGLKSIHFRNIMYSFFLYYLACYNSFHINSKHAYAILEQKKLQIGSPYNKDEITVQKNGCCEFHLTISMQTSSLLDLALNCQETAVRRIGCQVISTFLRDAFGTIVYFYHSLHLIQSIPTLLSGSGTTFAAFLVYNSLRE